MDSLAALDANASPQGASRGFKEDGLALWNNREYMLLLWSFSIGLGIVNAILTLIFQYVEPYGYSNEDAGVFGAVLIMGGVVGAGVAAYIMERTHAYGRIYSACFAACGVMVLFLCFMLYPNNNALLTLAFTLLGSTLVPIFPICLENCVETTYPISEDYSVGVLLSVANVVTVGITFAMAPLIDLRAFGPLPCTPVNAFIVALMGVGLYIAWQFKGENKRLGTDQQGKADREARAARGGVPVPIRAPAPAPI
jgi:Na+/melibiose symporter-like transporter